METRDQIIEDLRYRVKAAQDQINKLPDCVATIAFAHIHLALELLLKLEERR